MVSQKPKYCKSFERNSHWRKLSMIMVWERYCIRFSKTRILFIFVYIFIHISANMNPFGLKFSQMILHTETSKLMYNWSFLFVVLHKPTLLTSTFKVQCVPLYRTKRTIKCHLLLLHTWSLKTTKYKYLWTCVEIWYWCRQAFKWDKDNKMFMSIPEWSSAYWWIQSDFNKTYHLPRYSNWNLGEEKQTGSLT